MCSTLMYTGKKLVLIEMQACMLIYLLSDYFTIKY